MKLVFENPAKKSKALKYVIYSLIALALTFFQIGVVGLIDIGGVTPDLLLILCVWIALSEGQFEAVFAGFGIGLIYDIFSFDVIGTNALAKTVAAFAAGYFYRENIESRAIGNIRFLFIVLGVSILHNMIYFFFYIKPSEINYFAFFLKYGVASSLYTTVFSVIAMLGKLPRRKLSID